MTTVTFYEKPGCINNSRQKAMLAEAGHRLIVRNLLLEPWTPARLRPFFGALPVDQWFNTTAPAIKTGLVVPHTLDDETALELMVLDPLLIRRPLLQIGAAHHVGFDLNFIDQWIGLTATTIGVTVSGRLDVETCPRSNPKGS
jgi:nitrogenase-associated protein